MLFSCGKSADVARIYQMGEKVPAGSLIYTVLDADWRTELPGAESKQAPKDRFLVLHVTVTNSGGSEVVAPLGTLINKQGNEFGENQEMKGLGGWLGILRRMAPAATETGYIVFDVPVGAYTLRVGDGGDVENEKTAIIQIPLDLKGEGPAPEFVPPSATK